MRYPILIFLSFLSPLAWTSPFSILLDPGHTPNFPGAIGCRAKEEVHYNDDLVELLAKKLSALPMIKVLVSRTREQEIELSERAELANRAKVDLFLAVHHDSANPKYLVEFEVGPKKAFCLSPELKKKFNVGFSLFVSKKNAQYHRSLKFAEALGKEMVKLRRPISDYHTEKLENENRSFVSRKWGVYQYDDLIVLKQTKMPAVLIEAAVISDAVDEAYVSDAANREILSDAIVRAIQTFLAR